MASPWSVCASMQLIKANSPENILGTIEARRGSTRAGQPLEIGDLKDFRRLERA